MKPRGNKLERSWNKRVWEGAWELVGGGEPEDRRVMKGDVNDWAWKKDTKPLEECEKNWKAKGVKEIREKERDNWLGAVGGELSKEV